MKDNTILRKSLAFSVRIVNLHETNYLSDKAFNSLHSDLLEILRILTAICKHYPQSNQSICNL